MKEIGYYIILYMTGIKYLDLILLIVLLIEVDRFLLAATIYIPILKIVERED